MVRFSFILSIGLSISLSIFVCMHSILICLNTTTIEMYIYGCRKFPFSGPTMIENIREKLGRHPATWFLPCFGLHEDKEEGKFCNINNLMINLKIYFFFFFFFLILKLNLVTTFNY